MFKKTYYHSADHRSTLVEVAPGKFVETFEEFNLYGGWGLISRENWYSVADFEEVYGVNCIYTREGIANAISILEDCEHAADIAEARYECKPEDDELEQAFDAAYTRQWTYNEIVADALTEFLHIDKKTARVMLRPDYRNKIKAILAA